MLTEIPTNTSRPFYRLGKLNERFLNLEKKYNYSGLAIFASQLVTDDLAEKLAKKINRDGQDKQDNFES